MKTYKYLWDDFISDNNIRRAIQRATRDKNKKRKDIAYALSDVDRYVIEIKEYALNYSNDNHTPKEIFDGISRKKRTILIPSFRELVIQHMLIQVLEPMFLQGIYEFTYGSIPKRGAHNGAKAIEKWIRNDPSNVKYCLKTDIKHYFDSIDHDILKSKLKKYIKDKKILNILLQIIDVTDVGLPLGFYTSQWLSMWFLKDFDHFVKEQCYSPHYMRYADDIVIFGSNKRSLWETYEKIVNYLGDNKLEFNNRRQLFRFSYIIDNKEYGRALDFMGFVFHRNRTTLRRGIYYKMCRKAKKIANKEKPSIYELRQMMSYLGWIDSTDIYEAYEERIKPLFNIQNAKRRISRYDKRISKLSNKKGDNNNVETK